METTCKSIGKTIKYIDRIMLGRLYRQYQNEMIRAWDVLQMNLRQTQQLGDVRLPMQYAEALPNMCRDKRKVAWIDSTGGARGNMTEKHCAQIVETTTHWCFSSMRRRR